MELTQEYFDQQLAQLNKRFDEMVTKDDLSKRLEAVATKDDLKAQTKELEDYADSVAATIIEAVDNSFEKVNRQFASRDEKLKKVERDVQQLKGALHLP